MYSVYQHTCPNKKVYIGITSQNPELRWMGGYGYKNNTRFFHDILKYGWDNIEHKILHSGLPQSDAQSIEAQLITQYDSTNPQKGYNLIGGSLYSQSRPVVQYSCGGEFVTKYNSAAEAARAVGSSPSVISKAAKGNGVSHGYLWKYLDDDSPLIIPNNIDRRIRATYGKTFRRPTNKLAVSQYTFDGEFVATYPSISEASKQTGIKMTSISGCCKGDNSTAKIKRYSAGGYIWKYAENKEEVG